MKSKEHEEQARQAYRSLRRNIAALNYLEGNLAKDETELRQIVDAGHATSMEVEFVNQSLLALQESAWKAHRAISTIHQIIVKSGLSDEEITDKLAAGNGAAVLQPLVTSTLGFHGGVAALFNNGIGQLERRLRVYHEAANGLDIRDPKSIMRSLEGLKQLYVNMSPPLPLEPNEDYPTWDALKQAWQNLLGQQSAKSYQDAEAEGSIPYIELRHMICRNPRLAQELGLPCPDEKQDFLILCIFRPLICVVVLVVLIVSEGSAH